MYILNTVFHENNSYESALGVIMYFAQVNVSEILYPVTDERFIRFAAGARVINKKIRTCRGFIDGEQTYDGGQLFITRSVWESPQDLVNFAYSGVHKTYMKMARTWFKASLSENSAMWFTKDAELPSIPDSLDKLCLLRESGVGDNLFSIEWLMKNT